VTQAQEALDTACEQIPRLRRALKKSTTRQVGSNEERQLVKSTALAWFNNLHAAVSLSVAQDGLAEINNYYRDLIGFADRLTSRDKYDVLLKALGSALTVLRRDFVSGIAPAHPQSTPDVPPNFSKITSDARMQDILRRRWIECGKCVDAKAPLAATVMMGGMLESLLVARANMEPDKARLFASNHVPTDHKTRKKIPLQDWTLKTYIEVALDLKWITQSAKDIGEVIRDYRNYVHPHKEYSHNVSLNDDDADMFWEITKRMARQLLA
jgi:hypothetical protein